MNRFTCCLTTLAITGILLTPSRGMAQGSTYDYSTGARATRMWIPPGLDTIRGIFIYGNGAGSDSRAEVEVPWNQAFAYKHGFAMIATSMWGNLSGSEINTWDQHLAQLALLSGHPELVHAPWAPIGFSNGGQMSYGFNALRPEKTIAFITNKGCCYNFTTPSEAALQTPGILIAGELDTATRRTNIKSLFDTNRPRGAKWSWVEQEGEAHSGRADALVLPFMAEAIRVRYPAGQLPTATAGIALNPVSETSGWLVNHASWTSGLTQISSYDDFPGIEQRAGWLLNENVAFVYRAFSTYDRDAVLRFDLPVDLEAWAGFTSQPLALQLDLSDAANWSRLTLFDYAQPILELNRSSTADSLLTLDVPIPHSGAFAFSALIEHADGHFSTSNPLAYFAVPVPEPGHLVLIGAALACLAGQRNSQFLFTK